MGSGVDMFHNPVICVVSGNCGDTTLRSLISFVDTPCCFDGWAVVILHWVRNGMCEQQDPLPKGSTYWQRPSVRALEVPIAEQV